jgi:hypothetical protein
MKPLIREARTACWTLPIAGLTSFVFLTICYSYFHSLYIYILSILGTNPTPTAYIDLQHVSGAIACARQGFDVYAINPCDIYQRPYAYSPLFLYLPIPSISPTTLEVCGSMLAILFLASLFALPYQKNGKDLWLLLAGTLSTTTAFAAERGNLDQLIFLLAIVFIRLSLVRWPMRGTAYAVAAAATLMKFYPIVLFFVIVRESLRRSIIIALAASILIGSLFWEGLPALKKMVPNIPTGSYFSEAFGAVNLPYGLVSRLLSTQSGTGKIQQVIGILFFALITISCLTVAIRIGRKPGFRAGLSHLKEYDKLFLLVGAALIFGCFFVAQNIWYRAIYLLFTISGFLALRHVMSEVSDRRLCIAAASAQIFLMWEEFFRTLLLRGFNLPGWEGQAAITAANAFWAFRELIWWWTIAVLGAVLFAFLIDSRALTEMGALTKRLHRRV